MTDRNELKPIVAPRVVVIGVGGTGSALVPLLAASELTMVTLVDGDTVELANLSRQPLYGVSDVGRPKVEAAGDRIRPLVPSVEWRTNFQFLSHENAMRIIQDHDVIVDCTDDLNARALIDRTCAELGLPLVSGAVHGMQVQVITRHSRTTKRKEDKTAFFPDRPSQEQEGCDMRAVPAAVTTIAASLMVLRINDLIAGGHGHAGMMDLVDIEHGRWMRIMGPAAGEMMDSPIAPSHHA